MFDKTEISRFVVLLVGVILLVFTFFNAYLFLREDLSIVSTFGFVDLFGEALGPLVETCLQVMYLCIMGWIGSVLTIRGVQLLTSPKPEVKPETLAKVETATKRAKISGQPSAKTRGKKNK